MAESAFFLHPLAEVEAGARVGSGTRIWRCAHIRAEATIGEMCTIGDGVFIDARVQIGARVKIQNYVSVYEGVTIEDGVFIGPHVSFTNDRYPRAITPDGHLKSAHDWEMTPTLVRYGASIGAGAVIVCGITIGSFALIGSGAVVTADVVPHGLVFGNPARLHGYVCACARPLTDLHRQEGGLAGWCDACQKTCLVGSGGA